MITDGCWSGQRCFVIGGGASLRDFDWSRLDGELVIGTNLNYEKPTIALAYDRRILAPAPKGKQSEFLALPGEKFYVDRSVEVRVAGVRFVPVCDKWSTRLEDGLARCCNCGVAAINLADILHADPIYLLGFDMYGEGGMTAQWHDKYPQRWHTKETAYDPMIKDCVMYKDAPRGRVINLNPLSRLDVWPKVEPDLVLQK